jgi:hypothetical protein
MARAFLLALLVILLGTWPFAAIKLPEVHAFVPTLAAALLVRSYDRKLWTGWEVKGGVSW